jgi:hypothetical protein
MEHMEQRLVLVSADLMRDRDLTASLKDFLEDGWMIQQISASQSHATHLTVVVLLGRQKSGRSADAGYAD